MGYTKSYQSATSSTSSTGTAVEMSSGDESSHSSTSVSATVASSTPDDSDALAASLGGEAYAVGEDTLAMGSVSGALVDGGSITTLDGSATMVSASEAPDGNAFTGAYTFAEVSEGAEFVFVVNQTTDISQQSASGRTSTSTSSTSIAAYDLQLDNTGTQGPVLQASDGENDGGGASTEPEPSSAPNEADGDWELDGNVAEIEFTGLAVSEDTYVSVDAYALVVEDELSLVGGLMVLAVN